MGVIRGVTTLMNVAATRMPMQVAGWRQVFECGVH